MAKKRSMKTRQARADAESFAEHHAARMMMQPEHRNFLNASTKTFVAVKRKGKTIKVRLGRKPPDLDKKTLRFDYFLERGASGLVLPKTLNVGADPAVQKVLDEMYENDQLGCCVISEKAHKCGVNHAQDNKGKPPRIATSREIVDQYHRICGGGDNGCNITRVLDDIVAKRFKVGGEVFDLDGYVQVDNTVELAKAGIYFTGQMTLGVDLPSAWTGGNKVWDVTTSRIVGGHDVGIFDWDDDKEIFYVSSWGAIYEMTFKAFTSTKWVGETYACLGPDWYGDDRLSPAGFMADELKKDLELLKQGRIPEIPPAALHRWSDLV